MLLSIIGGNGFRRVKTEGEVTKTGSSSTVGGSETSLMGSEALTIAAIGVVTLRLVVNRVDFDVSMTSTRLIVPKRRKTIFVELWERNSGFSWRFEGN